MTNLRQAAQQALEALADSRRSHHYCEDTWYSCPKHEGGCANEAEGDECNCGADKANEKIDQAITAIEQALAEPEQKPVAWYCNQGLKRGVSLKQESPEWMPLYTALRAALAEPERQWVSLTEQEMYDLFFHDQYGPRLPEYLVNTIKCIEAALKEKNNGS